MKTGVIIYQSKYGATQKYADWLREMTGFDCVKTQKAVLEEVTKYQTIILCGGIYGSGIAGLKFLKKNIGRLRGRKIAILCEGASPYDKNAFEELKKHNLKNELENIPLFYGRGQWKLNQMTFVDRTLCTMLKKSIAKKDPSTYEPWMAGLMSAVGPNEDWTDKKYLAPLLEYVKMLKCKK